MQARPTTITIDVDHLENNSWKELKMAHALAHMMDEEQAQALIFSQLILGRIPITDLLAIEATKSILEKIHAHQKSVLNSLNALNAEHMQRVQQRSNYENVLSEMKAGSRFNFFAAKNGVETRLGSPSLSSSAASTEDYSADGYREIPLDDSPARSPLLGNSQQLVTADIFSSADDVVSLDDSEELERSLSPVRFRR